MKVNIGNVRIAATLAAILVAGCASAPTQQQLANADYGAPMSPSECKERAEQVIANQLKDPSSAQFRNEAPCFTGWMSSVPILGMKVAFGYLQEGEVNGKNSFGGYVGFRPYMVLIRNGEVVRSCMTDSDGICMPSGN